jgi:anti-sigma B factor antagonist
VLCSACAFLNAPALRLTTRELTMSSDTSMTQYDLQIAGELSIYRADELKQALLEHLQAGVRQVVDLAAVTELDTCGLQLLMLAKRTANAVQAELHLVGHSPAVLEVFELLNLAAYFGDPLVIEQSSTKARSAA